MYFNTYASFNIHLILLPSSSGNSHGLTFRRLLHHHISPTYLVCTSVDRQTDRQYTHRNVFHLPATVTTRMRTMSKQTPQMRCHHAHLFQVHGTRPPMHLHTIAARLWRSHQKAHYSHPVTTNQPTPSTSTSTSHPFFRHPLPQCCDHHLPSPYVDRHQPRPFHHIRPTRHDPRLRLHLRAIRR
jgi:hypothetical protein